MVSVDAGVVDFYTVNTAPPAKSGWTETLEPTRVQQVLPIARLMVINYQWGRGSDGIMYLIAQ